MAADLMRIVAEAQGDDQRTLAGEYAHLEKLMRVMCHPEVLPMIQGTPAGDKLVKMIGDRLQQFPCVGSPDTFTDAMFLFTSYYKYPKKSGENNEENPQ